MANKELTNKELTNKLNSIMTEVDKLNLIVGNLHEFVFDDMNVIHDVMPAVIEYPEYDTSDNNLPF